MRNGGMGRAIDRVVVVVVTQRGFDVRGAHSRSWVCLRRTAVRVVLFVDVIDAGDDATGTHGRTAKVARPSRTF